MNGYSFIVSNNGYVLLHPDLRPVVSHIFNKHFTLRKKPLNTIYIFVLKITCLVFFKEDGILKRNYNSIDLTEVEQFDDGVDGRQPGETLLTVNQKNYLNERFVL